MKNLIACKSRPGLAVVILVLLSLAPAIQAQTHTSTLTATTGTLTLASKYVPGSRIVKHTMTWTSSADGNVTVTIPQITGEILRVVTNPGSTAPSDNYDITLNDEDGLDSLAGGGGNRDTANTEHFAPFVGDGTSTTSMTVAGDLSFAITNAGATKGGALILYVRR